MHKKLCLGFLFIALSLGMPANILAAGIPFLHSHNDYLQTYPFWEAYIAGCKSMEIDVILRNDTLYVAHEKESIQANRHFESLYIEPLENVFSPTFIIADRAPIQYLIDLKTESISTLTHLSEILQNYPQYFDPKINPQAVQIVITGHVPPVNQISLFPGYLLYDLREPVQVAEYGNQAGIISRNFADFTIWNGLGRPVEKELQNLESFIDSCHEANVPIRFWNAPDTKTTWQLMIKLGVDYINTDRPLKASAFLKNYQNTSYKSTYSYTPYQPAFKPGLEAEKVKNIILLIGDGMGFGQLTAGFLGNNSQLCATLFGNMGFIATSSADNYGTDSAAAGTALATGKKTRNRFIGVDTNGNSMPNLSELLAQKGMKTGIITTDRITGATPAAFYAHVDERDHKEEILQDLNNSQLSIIAGYPASTKESIASSFIQVVDLANLNNLNQPAMYYFPEAGTRKAYSSNASLELATVTQHALRLMENEKGFFLMVECSGIDGGGHANDLSKVTEEVINFDRAVSEATAFADAHPGTLVIVTADHETSGMVIRDANPAQNYIEASFFSNDHTGSWVPIMSYGAGSDIFSGRYENTEIFHKILKLVED